MEWKREDWGRWFNVQLMRDVLGMPPLTDEQMDIAEAEAEVKRRAQMKELRELQERWLNHYSSGDTQP